MTEPDEIGSVPFGARRIGGGEAVLVIAEIGINHEGDPEVCARMIDEAAGAGADAVKLQTIDAEENYARGTESHALFSRAGLSREETARMFELARQRGLEVFTTAGDFATIDWVTALEPAAHKISSGLFTNLPLIRYAARSGRALLMSTGMAEAAQIEAAMSAAREAGAGGLALLRCTSLYPAPPESLNLAAIAWLERRYRVPAGFSDHSLGTEAAALATAAGARMIEKHLSLDPSRPGYDHPVSLDPSGFAEMVRRVRAAEAMLGRAEKWLSSAEREAADRFHRVLVARTEIAAGELFDERNLALKRPPPGSRGLAPELYERVIGRRARRALSPDEPVVAEAVEGEL